MWSTQSRKTGNVTFTACSQAGKPILLKLEGVRIPFEPSAYQLDAATTRKTICVAGATDDVIETIRALETEIGATSSAVRENLLRFKFDQQKVRIWDSNGCRIEAPEKMRGWTANVQAQVRGKWTPRSGSGLCVETTDIMLLREAPEPECPW